MNFTKTQHLVNQQAAAMATARTHRHQERAGLAAAKQIRSHLQEALVITQTVAREVQELAHGKIADIVSHSLAAVFEEPYKFKLNFEQKRGRTEAALAFERDGQLVDPMEASGGGVVDVAAFALRLSCLLLANPPLRRLLVLDEPLKMLSAEYRPRVRELIERLSKELGVQMVIVTHSPEFLMGQVIEL